MCFRIGDLQQCFFFDFSEWRHTLNQRYPVISMLILLKVPSSWRHTTFLHVLVVYSAGLAKPAGLAMEIFNSLEERATDKEICVGREGLPYRNGRQW